MYTILETRHWIAHVADITAIKRPDSEERNRCN